MFIYELSFAPFATIINCFAFFIVIKHTPATMKQYRKYLIGVQFWMAVFDLCVHALIRPLFFFPYVAMGATGFLSHLFHIPAHLQMSCMMLSLCANFAGLMSTLMYRRNQMLPPGSFKFSETQMRLSHCSGVIMQVANCIFYYIAGLNNLGPLGATFTLFLLPMGFSFVTIFTQMDAPILQMAISYIPSFHSTVYTLILLIHTPVYLDATLCYLRLRKDSRMRRPTLIEPSHSETTVQRPKPVKTQSLTSNIVH
ncbi:unnamed protein product, partial [Mesorhabditis belari]|uniref:Uncharacterized protein n=1 Tax=Mesorhabditis belari TaxID=2138241 RepID=A0AAF3FKY5_9BILA